MGEEEEGQLDAATVEKQLKSLKWHLWHGNVYQVLQRTEDLECDLDSGVDRMERVKKLLWAVSEFHHYTEVNRALVPNYGAWYRHGEAISTAFVESR